jgi:hypothetical protein
VFAILDNIRLFRRVSGRNINIIFSLNSFIKQDIATDAIPNLALPVLCGTLFADLHTYSGEGIWVVALGRVPRDIFDRMQHW